MSWNRVKDQWPRANTNVLVVEKIGKERFVHVCSMETQIEDGRLVAVWESNGRIFDFNSIIYWSPLPRLPRGYYKKNKE